MKLSTSNWSSSEDEYHRERKEVLGSTKLEEYVDHPFVFAKRQSVASSLARIKLFEMVAEVKGSVVECGVHRGNNLMLYYHLSSILEPFAFNRKIIGFDTFEGFRSLSEEDPESLTESHFSDADDVVLSRMLRVSDHNRPV